VTRINAAVRAHGVTYSQFMNGLKKANVMINRKMLSEMAIHDAQGFAHLVTLTKGEGQSVAA
jgi:large subunit ribosomal protein L20